MLLPMTTPAHLRQPCPPGACTCGRDRLPEQELLQLPILCLTRAEEKRLLERLENLHSLDDLEHMQRKMLQLLGIRVQVAPGFNEVRSMRGIQIQIDDTPGLCRKTRQTIPAAIRRALEKNPQIAYSLLNANDLLRDA